MLSIGNIFLKDWYVWENIWLFLHEKWLNLDFHRQIPCQYYHIVCGLFLENTTIFRDFNCKYEISVCPMLFEKLSTHHDRANFDCGNDKINTYLHKFAKQHTKKGIAKVHILADNKTIIGFYTLSNAELTLSIQGYPNKIPAMLIGKMGVDKHYQGQGLSKVLLSHALNKIKWLSDETGIAFVIIDAKDEGLATYYQTFGFTPTTQPLRLIMAVKEIDE